MLRWSWWIVFTKVGEDDISGTDDLGHFELFLLPQFRVTPLLPFLPLPPLVWRTKAPARSILSKKPSQGMDYSWWIATIMATLS